MESSRKMKKIFSIQSNIKTLFILQILLLLFIILPLTITVSNFIYNKNLESSKRETFKQVNQLVVEIKNSGTVSSNIIEKYNNLQLHLDDISLILDRQFELSAPEYSDVEERDRYVKQIANLATELIDSINSSRLKKSIFLLILSAVTLFTALGITAYIFFLNFKFSCFTKRMRNQLNNINNLLNFHKPEKISENSCRYSYSETSVFTNILGKITENIERDMKIQDIDIHGNLDDILKFIHTQISDDIKCDRIALAFIDKKNNVIAETAYASYNQLFLQPGFTENIAKTSLKMLIRDRKPRIINNLTEYAKKKDISSSTTRILKEQIKSSLTVPMFFQNRCIGFLFISSRKEEAYTAADSDFAERIAGILKQKLYVEFLIQEIIAETSNSFITLMHEKDNETSLHTKRMTEYSYLIAAKYYSKYNTITPRFIREIKWFAPLHDIGKVGIPDSILLKEGPLDSNEFSIMKTHVDTGLKVLENMNNRLNNIMSRSVLQTAIDIIGGHHEKYSGAGYPQGLKENEIPLAGRIVAVADVFDALTSSRPYKKAFPVDKAVDIMENGMKGHFDPDIIECFKDTLPEILEIYNQFKEI